MSYAIIACECFKFSLYDNQYDNSCLGYVSQNLTSPPDATAHQTKDLGHFWLGYINIRMLGHLQLSAHLSNFERIITRVVLLPAGTRVPGYPFTALGYRHYDHRKCPTSFQQLYPFLAQRVANWLMLQTGSVKNWRGAGSRDGLAIVKHEMCGKNQISLTLHKSGIRLCHLHVKL